MPAPVSIRPRGVVSVSIGKTAYTRCVTVCVIGGSAPGGAPTECSLAEAGGIHRHQRFGAAAHAGNGGVRFGLDESEHRTDLFCRPRRPLVRVPHRPAQAEGDVLDGGGLEQLCERVGDDEADIKLGKVSVNSPIARALIGKEAGDVAEVQAPGGLREYEVLDVQYL